MGGGGEVRFDAVEGGEEGVDVGVVSFLGCGEAAFVDAVVDGVVDCHKSASFSAVARFHHALNSPHSFISSISFLKCSG